VPGSLIDTAGLRVSAEDFLGAVLETAAQPIWVVDPDGLIRFANPAAIAALGYDSADQLFGRQSHETIHYKHPDGSPYPAADCPMLLPHTTGERVSSDLDWFVRRDGSMFAVSYLSVPIEMPEGRGAVVAFTDIDDRMRAERSLREHDAVLAAEQASLRRVATLVAGGATSAEVFSAIAREVAQVLGVALVVIWRTDPDRPATVVGAWADRPHPFQAGTTWPVEEHTAAVLLPEVGHPTKIQDFGEIGGVIPDAIAETGIRSGTGAAIVVDGEVWGVMGAGVAATDPVVDRIEDQLAEFTELVATAISNTARGEQLARLADEQAALRRVATLIARESPAADVFAAVAEELGRLLDADTTRLVRYDEDGMATVVSTWDPPGDAALAGAVPVGTRMPVGGMNIVSLVAETEKPARIDDYGNATGAIAAYGRRLGFRSAVGGPIVVAGRLWGAMVVSSRRPEPMPAGTEAWIGEFAELIATAVANIQARSDLATSRARLVAATDDERRRVVRDLHDGAQQRLVHTVITLKLACRALEHEDETAPKLVGEALQHVEAATEELRELVHGILPAVLTHGGLRAAVEALAARTPVRVEIDVSVGRLPALVEASAYFVVAEALTNVAKHAQAECAAVVARLAEGRLCVEVRDDGAGGARPDGSGLVGLTDRLAVLNGRLRVESPAGGGTLVAATIPVSEEDLQRQPSAR
jgi:PAS domain S-box-containing protein